MGMNPGYEFIGGTPYPLQQEASHEGGVPVGVCLDPSAAIDAGSGPFAPELADPLRIPVGTFIAKDSDFSCYVVADGNRLGVEQDLDSVLITKEEAVNSPNGGVHVPGWARIIWTNKGRIFYNGPELTLAQKQRIEQRLWVFQDSH